MPEISAKPKLYFSLYIIAAFFFGMFWYSIKAELNAQTIVDQKVRFLLRFAFGLGYMILALVYCKLANKTEYIHVLSQIYFVFEGLILHTGLFRYFIADHPVVITFYSTLLGVTVSPLGLLLTHVLISIRYKRSLVKL